MSLRGTRSVRAGVVPDVPLGDAVTRDRGPLRAPRGPLGRARGASRRVGAREWRGASGFRTRTGGGGGIGACRSPRALEHGGRLREQRALAARRVRGDPSGALAAARGFADEPVLRVADLGAADGVNSHGLIRDLPSERDGRPLLYSLVDLPTNTWGVATEHLRGAFGDDVAVIPAPDDADPASPMPAPGRTSTRRRPTARPCRRGIRAEPGSGHGREPGGHPAPAGALPARRQRARLGQRDGDALGRRLRRPGLDGLGFSGLSRTTSTKPSGRRGARPRRASGSGSSSCAPASSPPAAG